MLWRSRHEGRTQTTPYPKKLFKNCDRAIPILEIALPTIMVVMTFVSQSHPKPGVLILVKVDALEFYGNQTLRSLFKILTDCNGCIFYEFLLQKH